MTARDSTLGARILAYIQSLHSTPYRGEPLPRLTLDELAAAVGLERAAAREQLCSLVARQVVRVTVYPAGRFTLLATGAAGGSLRPSA